MLACHVNTYTIIKILLDSGQTLPIPHDIECLCGECHNGKMEDSLRHSQELYHLMKSLASPALICLTSKDVILTAFELSFELSRLARYERQFSKEYNELSQCCKVLNFCHFSIKLEK